MISRAALLLAESKLLPAADASQQKGVSDLLKQRFIQDTSSWVRHTTPEVAGAAIERAGRIIDALQFYENVMASPAFTPEQKQRAQRRWIKTKYRQAEREEREYKTQPAQRHNNEAEEKIRAWGITDVTSLSEYPSLKGFTEPVAKSPEPPSAEKERVATKPVAMGKSVVEAPTPLNKPLDEHLVWTVGDLAFHDSPEAGRINIEHRLTLETATLKLRERACTSGDMEFVEEPNHADVFRCPKWQIECDLTNLEEAGIVHMRFLDTGFEVQIPIGPA